VAVLDEVWLFRLLSRVGYWLCLSLPCWIADMAGVISVA